MAKTESKMVELGTEAPAFELVDVISGKVFGRDDLSALAWDDNISDGVNKSTRGGPKRKHGLLVIFLCPHCPYVIHVEQELGRIGRDYCGEDGPIAMVGIQPNDVAAYPEDGPDGMRAQAKRSGWNFPYLLDETQEIARAYEAACTPDFFLFDAEMKLVYRGQLDDSRPRRENSGNDTPVTGRDLRAALDAVIAGKRPDPNQHYGIGCSIKWREGNA